jgi:gamma-glutamylputrescine oxidase
MPQHAPLASAYAAAAPAPPPRPSLTGRIEADACVVGAGLFGLSAALELAARGLSVAVLEAAHVGWGASGRNGGQVIRGYNRSMGELEARLGAGHARALWDLAEEGRRMIGERVAAHAIDCSLTPGFLYAGLKDRHRAEAEAFAEECARYGADGVRVLDADGVRALVATRRYTSGAFDPGGAHLDPLAYVRGLAGAAEAAGARVYEGSRVVRLGWEGGAHVAETAAGAVRAGALVLAGNALLGRLEPRLDRMILPVTTGMVATAPLGAGRAAALIPSGAAVSDMNLVLDYFRLSPDGRLLFGGGVTYAGLETPGLAAALRRRMLRVFPDLADVAVERAWWGRIDMSLDRMPQVGRLDGGALYAQGFSGHGLALTQIAGRVVAEAVAGRTDRFDAFARLPRRPFPGGRWLRRPALVAGMAWARLADRF